MGDASARFNVELGASAPGVDATTAAAEKLRATIQADQKAVLDLQKALKSLQGGASVNIETQRNLQKQLDAKKAAVSSNVQAYVGLGGSLGELGKKTKETADKSKDAAVGLDEVTSAAQAAGGPVGGLFGRAQQLASVLGKAGVAGAAVIAVVAILAVLGAVVAATFALASFALGAADAARSAGILRDAAAGSAAAGARLGAEVAQLAGRIATPRAEIEALALSLARSGLSGNALQTALSAIATTSAVMGQAAGGALQSIIDNSRRAKRFLINAMDLQGTGIALKDVGAAVAKRLGISVQAAVAALQNGQIKLADGIAALDDVTQAKFGAAAAAQMLALPTQVLKAKEALTAMFAGVKIDGFLKALHEVLSLLDESSITGRALKVVFETLLNPIFDGVAKAGPFARAFFQGLIINALIFAIAVVKVKNAISEAFGGKGKSDIVTLENALLAGKAAFIVVGAAVAALTIVLGILAVAMALVALPFVVAGFVMYQVISGIATGVGWLIDLAASVVDTIAGTDLGAAGFTIVTGFVNALLSGPGLVAKAAGNLAKAALTAIAGVLDSHSPSRATGKLAGYATTGFTNQIEEDTPDVQGAMAAAFAPPDPSGAAAGGKAAAGGMGGAGGGGFSFTWTGNIYIGGRKQLKDPDLESEMADLFHRALQRGGYR